MKEEVVNLAEANTPLQVPSDDGTTTRTNCREYFNRFRDGLGLPPPGFAFEASRATTVVMMDHMFLVEMFMNVNRWSCMFASIVPKAQTTEVLSSGTFGTYHGLVHKMVAEFHLPTPFVPTRSDIFVRSCKQHRDGLWSIVDVCIGNSPPDPLRWFRRRPSECVIEALADGYSRVTWVEHIEVDDRFVHQLYKPLVGSTLAFGARRWLGTLKRQCERLANVCVCIPTRDLASMGVSNQEARRSILRLAARVVRGYHQDVSSTTAHTWTIVSGSGAGDVRIMSRKCVDETGWPTGLLLCGSSSFWAPVPPQTILNFFSDVRNRGQWDLINCSGGQAEELVHLGTGREINGFVSLLRFSGTNDPIGENMMIIQECCTDGLGSSVIWAPMDWRLLDGVLAGGDSDDVEIMPAGISILPDGTRRSEDTGGDNVNVAGGSLLTVALQLVINSDPHARVNRLGYGIVKVLTAGTVDKIKACVTELGGNNNNNNDNALAVANNVNLVNNNAGPDSPMNFQG